MRHIANCCAPFTVLCSVCVWLCVDVIQLATVKWKQLFHWQQTTMLLSFHSAVRAFRFCLVFIILRCARVAMLLSCVCLSLVTEPVSYWMFPVSFLPSTYPHSVISKIRVLPSGTDTHTHPFNGFLSRTTRVSRYQKGKTNLDFTEARDSEWQWHQLGHMQVCTPLQTYNHASTPPLIFYGPDAIPAAQPTASKH